MTGRRPARRPARRRPARPAEADALAWVEAACADRKAVDGVVLDLRSVSDATDYFVVVSGTSDTHVRAIAEHVLEDLRERGVRAHHIEGLAGGRWVLLDFVDFVVHVFHPALREFYQLEGLWADAPQRAIRGGEERR
ncbi:MAG TPA: ribosome silencing factor [Gemmatimonadales bacterium]|nr:ribosome silencing factor [Gemmatimonadales bacterium]